MVSGHPMRIAERNLVDGATLDELRDTATDLRALTPDSALAELVEARIAEIENPPEQHGRSTGRAVSNASGGLPRQSK